MIINEINCMNELEKIVFSIEAEIDSNLLESLEEIKNYSGYGQEALKPFKIPYYPSGASAPDYKSHAEFYSKKLNTIISILRGKKNDEQD